MVLATWLEGISWAAGVMTGILGVVIGQKAWSSQPGHPACQPIQQKLHESEQRFYKVFDQAPDVMQLYAPDGTLRYSNRPGETLWGNAPAVLEGYNVLQDAQVLAAGHLPALQQVFAGEAVTLPPLFYNPAMTGAAGGARWLEGTAYPVKTDTGAVQEVVLVIKDITARTQAELALQSTEERLRHVNEALETKVAERTAALAQSNSMLQATLEATAEGILVLDCQGKAVNFNARFLELWGMPDSVLEALSHGQAEAMASFALEQLKDPETFLQVTSEMLSQLECETFDVLALKQGRVLERYARPQWLHERCIGKVLSFRDITERRQAESALQLRSQQTTAVIGIQQEMAALSPNLEAVLALTVERVQALTHASGAVIEMVEGDELVYRAANGVAAAHVGLRLKINTSLSGRCVETGEILGCDDTETDARVDRAACRRLGIRSMVVVPLSQQSGKAIGVLKAFSATTAAFTEQSVQTLQLLAGFLTNTLRLASQFQVKENLLAALQASESRYASVIAAMAEGVMLQNAEGKICASNASAERILGLSAEQMLGKASLDPHWQIMHEDGSPFPREQRPAIVTLRTGEPCRNVVVGVAKPDHQLTWISINTQPLFHPHAARPYAVVTSFADITERRQMEEALRQSEAHNRAILQALPDLLLRLRRDGLCLECLVPQGSQAESFVPIRQDVAEVLPPALRQRQLQDIEQAITTGELQVREHSFIKHGKLVYEEVRIAAINHNEALLIVRDISARKQAEMALQHHSEVRYRAIVEDQTELIIRYLLDGTITFANQAYALYFGQTPEALIGSRYQPIIFEADCEHVAQLVNSMNADKPIVVIENRVVVDGEVRWTLWHNRMLFDEHGQLLEFQAVGRDITALKQTEARLFHEKELAQVTLRSIGDAVITTDATGSIQYLNPVAEALTGWTQAEAQGLPLIEVFKIVHESTREPVPSPIEAALRDNQIVALANHTVLIARQGQELAIEDSAAPIHDREGQTIGAVMVFHDVTQTRTLARQLTWQASHDALTGLVNRREFERRVEQALSLAQLDHQVHALCYLDLDHFKIVNDTCGHVAGDALLRQVTTLLQEKTRKADTLARLGGDEFGVLLHQCTPEQALRVANALCDCVQAFRFVWQEQVFTIGASIGLISIDAESESLAEIISAADAACYTAKHRGRNRVYVAQKHDQERLQQRGEMQWVNRITQALENDHFCLYVQPIAAITSVAQTGDHNGDHYEVLLRLRDEQGNLVPPMAFIPAAERYNLMHLIDRWVVQTLFEGWSTIVDDDQSIYAINLSGSSINDDQFIDFLHEQFALHLIAPQRICFELTETVAIANLTKASQFIQELQRLGCRFALDDFGAGMSSFAYLKSLPVDYLKIDGSFIRNIVENSVDDAIVSAITHIGNVMGIRTIAEFVENDAILERIRALGIDYAQGYGIARPRPLIAR